MKKTFFPILFIILFSAISYAIMPSDAISWVMSAKDGTWTVKALGLSGGKEGQEAISWVMDPSGKIVSQSASAISDTCGGCLYMGQILMDPVTGAQGEVLKKLGESGSGWAPAVNEVVSIQSFLSKSDMKEGNLNLVHNPDGSYHIKEMSPVNIAGEAPDSFRKALGTDSKNVEAKVIYDKDKDKSTVILKPLPSSFGSESPAEHISVASSKTGGKDSDKKKYETNIGDFRSGSYVELQEVEGLEMVSKARIVSEEGQKYKINGNEIQASRDVALSVDSLSCKEGSCTTSMTIDSKVSRQSTSLGEGVVDVKEPVKISLCDNDLNVLSGSKLSVDIKTEGQRKSCVLKNADLKWSNSKEEFGDRQVVSFGNVYAHIDPQKWEHQEGYLKFDDKTNILEGTIRKADFNDGTILFVDGTTKRMATGSTDSMKVKLDSKGNFLSSSIDVKDRKVSLYNGKDKIVDSLEIKDPSNQPFIIKRDEKSQGYTISTPSWTYYKKLPDSKAEVKSNLVISESNNPDISPDLKNLISSMIGAPLSFQVPDGDLKIPINPPDSPELFGKPKPSEPSQKYVSKKGDSYWGIALDRELTLRNFNEDDKKEIIAASKKGKKEFLGTLKEQYKQYNPADQDFFIARLNKDILEDSKKFEKEYGDPSKLSIGKELDLSVIGSQSTTVVVNKAKPNTPVVIHPKGEPLKPVSFPGQTKVTPKVKSLSTSQGSKLILPIDAFEGTFDVNKLAFPSDAFEGTFDVVTPVTSSASSNEGIPTPFYTEEHGEEGYTMYTKLSPYQQFYTQMAGNTFEEVQPRGARTLRVLKPVDNFGIFFPELTTSSDILYVYRKEEGSKAPKEYKVYTSYKVISDLASSFGGLPSEPIFSEGYLYRLVGTEWVPFKVQPGDIVKSSKPLR